MAKLAYIPKSDSGKLQLLTNFVNKIGIHAARFNISPAEVTSVKNDLAMFKYALKMQEAFKTFKQSISTYKNLMRDGNEDEILGSSPVDPNIPAPPFAINQGIFKRFRRLVARIKAHPAYTEAIGEDFGIVGDEHVVDIHQLKPELKGRIVVGHPVIIWKKGVAEALDIYVNRKDGKGFVFLTTDSHPDYTDKHPMPKDVESIVWEYKAAYRINDEQVGKFSNIIRIAVTKQVGKSKK